MSELIKLNPHSRSDTQYVTKNNNNLYSINTKINYYIPYKDIFNSRVFKNNNQIIICYDTYQAKALPSIQSNSYRWVRYFNRNYNNVLQRLTYYIGQEPFYMKTFGSNYFIINNGYIGVVPYQNTNINSTIPINIESLMCLCLKTNKLNDFVINKQQGKVDKNHFALLIDYKFQEKYPLVYKKIEKEYIQNFRNEKFDIIYTNIDDKIYNTDKLVETSKFKNVNDLFNYLDSLNDDLKQI